MTDGIPAGLDCLTGEGAAGLVRDGDGDNDRQALLAGVEEIFNGVKAGLEVEGIKDRFRQEDIDPAFNKRFDLFVIRLTQFLVAGGTVFRTVHVGRHRGGAVRWADCPCNKSGTTLFFRNFIGHLAGDPGRVQVDIAHTAFESVVRLCDGGAREGIGLNDIRTRF